MKHLSYILTVAASAALCLVTACDKHTPYRPTNTSGTNPGGGTTPGGSTTIKAQLMPSWVIEYKGREDYTEENGSISRVERFHLEAPGAAYYLVRTINPDVFADNYGTDVVKFFQDEQGYLEEDARYYNEKVTDYLYNQSPQDVLFDMIRHGQWQGYLIGFDARGKVTGQYAKCTFNVQEETPTPAFSKWLGSWQVSDGTTTYDIEVSSSEANYAYFIDKWETGASIDRKTGTSMDGPEDYFETFYEPSNGAMYFTSQYIQTYEENDVTYNQFFFGNIWYNGRQADKGEYVIPEEGLDIAAALMNGSSSDEATIRGCGVKAYMSDDDATGIDTEFTSMQYFADDGKDLLKFNLNVPQFPLAMVKMAPATSHAAVVRRAVTKQSLKEHTRLRDVSRKAARRPAAARQAAGVTAQRAAS